MRTLIALATVAGLLLGGCGGSAERRAASAPSLEDASRVLEKESVRVEVGHDYTLGSETVTMRGSGVAKPYPYRVQVEARQGNSEGVVEFEVRKIGQLRFFSSPQLAKAMPDGKRWVRATQTGGLPNVLVPRDHVDFLTNAGDLRRASAELRGQQVTHVRGRVDPDAFGGEDGEAFKQLVAGHPVTIETWLDGRGRPLRIAMEWKDARGGVMKSYVDILEYGATVDVDIPAGEDVAEESELE
jgi:hypothetical protein